VFRLRLAAGDWTHFESICATRELVCYGGDPEYVTYPPVSFEEPNGLQRALQEPRLSLVLGNESNGLSSQARRICRPVAIPMAGDMESLNVAVAGGILMYLLRPDKS
jgi:TrmH family RNA methyltransferase